MHAIIECMRGTDTISMTVDSTFAILRALGV